MESGRVREGECRVQTGREIKVKKAYWMALETAEHCPERVGMTGYRWHLAGDELGMGAGVDHQTHCESVSL
jgi:hypothetical protein